MPGTRQRWRCILLILGLGLFAVVPAGAAPAWYYTCDDQVIRVEPIGDWEMVALNLGGQYHLLPRTIAASGVRFSDDAYTFWMRGTSARIEVDQQTVATCEVVDPRAPATVHTPRPDASAIPVSSYVERGVAPYAERVAASHARSEAWLANPVQIALDVAGGVEARVVRVVAEFFPLEIPDTAVVTVIRENLLDDSVYATWNEVLLNLGEGGGWQVVGVKEAYWCARGDRRDEFSAALCP